MLWLHVVTVNREPLSEVVPAPVNWREADRALTDEWLEAARQDREQREWIERRDAEREEAACLI